MQENRAGKISYLAGDISGEVRMIERKDESLSIESAANSSSEVVRCMNRGRLTEPTVAVQA